MKEKINVNPIVKTNSELISRKIQNCEYNLSERIEPEQIFGLFRVYLILKTLYYLITFHNKEIIRDIKDPGLFSQIPLDFKLFSSIS